MHASSGCPTLGHHAHTRAQEVLLLGGQLQAKWSRFPSTGYANSGPRGSEDSNLEFMGKALSHEHLCIYMEYRVGTRAPVPFTLEIPLHSQV